MPHPKTPAALRGYLTNVLVDLKAAAAEEGMANDITPRVIHVLREYIGGLLKKRIAAEEQTEVALAGEKAIEQLMPGND